MNWQYWLKLWEGHPEAVIALAALLLSIVTALFTVWMGLYSRLNARMSALPLLHTFRRISPEPRKVQAGAVRISGSIKTQLVNSGLGPAAITKYSVSANGEEVDLFNSEQVGRLIRTVFGLDPEAVRAEYFQFEGAVIVPKDGTLQVFELYFNANSREEHERIVGGLDRLHLRVEYESLYGDELAFDSAKAQSRAPRLGLFLRLRRPKK